ncbi:PREDICTED: neurturin [Tinamus guttatus]|uniref:neurturin n=1 Tax=Tinamus guttatus TaxID=94827 RepID=UPI00052F365E|nr:PREDICTED: neurturin [Tinamus guttatus]
MKVWKFAAIASMLLSSLLSILVCRDMLNGSRKYSPVPSSPASRASSSSSLPAAPRRPPRALDRHGSLLSQYGALLESYTEGELRRLLGALVERRSGARVGYESDETVLFRYCSGTNDGALRSYDLSLRSMRSSRRIRKEKVRARPCCRPLAYDDDVSFLDAYNRYYTVNELSAKECGCV